MKETTITIEFFAETEQHLRTLESRLKHLHDVEVNLLEPKDRTHPVLISIGIDKRGERAERAIQSVAQTLYNFLHEDIHTQAQKKVFLISIEGERVDIEPLSVEEIEDIIIEAKEGE